MAGTQGSMHLNNRPSQSQVPSTVPSTYPQHVSQPPPPPSTPSPAPFSMPMHMAPTIASMPIPPPSHHQQQQHYPAINSIPGMHPINHLGSGLQSTIQNVHVPSTTVPHTFPSMSTIRTMHSLLHPPGPPPSDQVSSQTHNQNHSLSTNPSHLSAPGPVYSSAILSGAVEKRRKAPRKPSRAHHLAYTSVLSPSDDPHSLVLAQHATAHSVSHPENSPAAAVAAAAAAAATSISPHPAVPMYEMDGVQFKLLEQLPDNKIQRLRAEKIKPIESLTFSDIKAYNRNQLRAYCSVYGIRRKKKADMERDMARYAAQFHPNDPAYDLHKFEPTEYASGPIPRRKVPVTKEQKELAAGDTKRLTNALQQRPSSVGSHSYVENGSQHHHVLANSHPMHPHPPAISAASRLLDIHPPHHSTAHTGQGNGHQGGHHADEHESVVVGEHELMAVQEMVPNHLLVSGIPHQIGEE